MNNTTDVAQLKDWRRRSLFVYFHQDSTIPLKSPVQIKYLWTGWHLHLQNIHLMANPAL